MRTVIKANKAEVIIIDNRSREERKEILEKAVINFYKERGTDEKKIKAIY